MNLQESGKSTNLIAQYNKGADEPDYLAFFLCDHEELLGSLGAQTQLRFISCFVLGVRVGLEADRSCIQTETSLRTSHLQSKHAKDVTLLHQTKVKQNLLFFDVGHRGGLHDQGWAEN